MRLKHSVQARTVVLVMSVELIVGCCAQVQYGVELSTG
jgi:hypothetical protein